MYLIEAYVTNASLNVNRPFTYVSDIPVEKYCRIKVIFNHAPNTALVSDCRYTDKTKEQLEEEFGYSLSEVIEIIDDSPVISQELFDLAFWLSRTTVSPLISCLNAMLPKALKTSKTIDDPRILKKIRKNGIGDDATKRQKEVYDELEDGMLTSEARKISVSIVNKLLASGVLTEYEEEAEYRNVSSGRSAFKTLTA
ncbi:MAG: hypothetical protein IKS69_02155, partial [Erysipelotrichaceae bacterium]|nr:hypothetical protein [Erysipelotrichaceae bacterium]